MFRGAKRKRSKQKTQKKMKQQVVQKRGCLERRIIIWQMRKLIHSEVKAVSKD